MAEKTNDRVAVCVKLPIDLKEACTEAAWAGRVSVTQYVVLALREKLARDAALALERRRAA